MSAENLRSSKWTVLTVISFGTLMSTLDGGMVSVSYPALAEAFETRNPLGRTGDHDELTNLAAYLLSDQSGFITGEVVTIDGGRWLAGAGQFNFASMLSDEDWQNLRPKKNGG